MTLLNFFKRHWQLARLVVKLRREAKTYRRQIGGYRGAYKKVVKRMRFNCDNCVHKIKEEA